MRRINKVIKSSRRLSRKIASRKLDAKLQHAKERGFVINKGGGGHISGLFWSMKNGKAVIFRSSYEFAYWTLLEANDQVTSFKVEPFSISYINPKDNRPHRYIPDALVSYRGGYKELVEIKPSSLVSGPIVQSKADAARKHIKKIKMNGEYRFITEFDVFKSVKAYRSIKKILLDKSHVL